MLEPLVLLLCVGAGIMGGVFFAFSSFVMRALSELPASQGVLAMQRINVVVLNPIFLSVFLGTAVLGVAAIAAAFMPWVAPRSPLVLVAGLLYVVGSFLVTGMFNVPRNDRLAGLRADSNEARAYWPSYVREWVVWNHVRTIASAAAAASSAAALSL